VAAGAELEPVGRRASEVLRKLGESIHVSRSFGPAYEHDGVMVIPVAVVGGGGGGGASAKPERGPEEGGGFGMVSWPIGAYVIKNGEVRWRPTFDVAMLTMIAVGFLKSLGKRRKKR
jgi:uncharacterized spore protein YtfJ